MALGAEADRSLAAPARHGQHGHDPVARAKTLDLAADLDDGPGALDAQDMGETHRRIGHDAGPRVGVEAVDARRLQADQQLARTDFRGRHLLVTQHLGPAVLVDENRLHATTSSSASNSRTLGTTLVT